MAFSVLLSVMPVRGHACSIPCPSYLRPDERVFQSAAAVFAATVVEKQGRDARLQVNEVYKGKVGPFIVVESGSRSACRYPFQQGRKYLLFKAPDEQGRIAAPGACTDPTTDLDADAAMVEALAKRTRVARERSPSAPPLFRDAR
jgi:hypothetical protein